MITIDSNPRAFSKAGLRLLIDADVLAIIGRVGISGIRILEISEAINRDTRDTYIVGKRLQDRGLVYSDRDGKRGRPNRYFLTEAGRLVLDRAIMVVDHSIVVQTPLPIS